MDRGMLSFMLGNGRVPALLVLVLGLGELAGCASKTDQPGRLTSVDHAAGGTGGSTGGGATGGSSAATSAGGGPGVINITGGSSGSSGSDTLGSAGSSDCGGHEYDAMLVPLDLYVMLDSSGSMADQVNGATKWDAIRSALTTFLTDPVSDGIGIGLQFFPLHDPNVPLTCTLTSQCGANNLCLNNYCEKLTNGFGICDTASDCVQGGRNYGPCVPLKHCFSDGGATPCHDDSECTGGAGDCVVIDQCSGDKGFICSPAGTTCRDSSGQTHGTCQTIPPVCENVTDCAAADYGAPAAEIAVLPNAAANLGKLIMAKSPDGLTPTEPALSGAIGHASAWAKSHAGHTVAVLLATDGLPTECISDPTNDPTGITGVTSVAKAGVSASPSISTFVIGVFSQNDVAMLAQQNEDPQSNLDQIAKAGGSTSAHIVGTGGNVEQEFLDALDAIRGTRLPCTFQIPTPTSGSFDRSEVNVQFSDAGQTSTLYYWPNQAACDATDGGWYYDDPNAPTQIIACPASCAKFQTASQDPTSKAKVSIELGCRTVVR